MVLPGNRKAPGCIAKVPRSFGEVAIGIPETPCGYWKATRGVVEVTMLSRN